jgi:hypothetical protein
VPLDEEEDDVLDDELDDELEGEVEDDSDDLDEDEASLFDELDAEPPSEDLALARLSVR